MPRPRKSAAPPAGPTASNLHPLASWAELLGEALGRGVARGINAGVATAGSLAARGAGGATAAAGRRGRPPKSAAGGVVSERQCKVEGCAREARSKGLCSAHYQAERRRLLAKKS